MRSLTEIQRSNAESHQHELDGDDCHEEESKSSRYDYEFDLSELANNNNMHQMSSNNNKPPAQPATAAVNSIHWDVEEDHLLSYFLGANENGANEVIPESGVATGQQQQQQQSPMITANNPACQQGSMTSIAEGVAGFQNYPLDNFVHAQAQARGSSSGLSTTSTSPGGLPPTPAVHFYNGHHQMPAVPLPSGMATMAMAGGGGGAMPAHSMEYNSFVHASQQHRHSANSLQNRSSSQGSMHKVASRTSTASTGSNSSSSSLTSMAAALALGAPNQVMYMQQKLQSRDQITGLPMSNITTSPITPVMGMGSPSGQEMMMLPPPPRFPNGVAAPGMMMPQQMPQNMQQQHIMHQAQHQQMQQQTMMHTQQQVMPQPVQTNMNQQQVNAASQNVQQQQQQQPPNFLPQMSPPVQQPIQHPQPSNHMGFPDPNSVASAVLAQTQRTHHPQQQQLSLSQSQTQLHQQQVQQQQQVSQQMLAQPQQQQIQIGLNGHSIPLTAVPAPNGSVFYQIDPSLAAAALPPGVAPAGLRYFAKAINEVSKSDEKEIDPKILAEKRQQRLARNRESARQSRRRKKEHLSNMGAKVQKLQRQLETEVRNKIRSMEGGLVRQQGTLLEKWLHKSAHIDNNTSKDLLGILRKTGPNCPIRRAVVVHQYNFLRQAFLSTHNHYSVWMMLQNSSFFTEASRRQQNSLALKGAVVGSAANPKASTTSTRANSKQIGEEIYNEEKMDGRGVTCHAHDELKTWPLYCHEITMTMEQEDRIINQAHSQARTTPNLQPKLDKMKKATDATKHLQNAMLCHTQLASQRNEKLLMEILTPAQTALFLEWSKKNKERCKGTMERQLQIGSAGSGDAGTQNGYALGGVYRQLEEMRLEK